MSNLIAGIGGWPQSHYAAPAGNFNGSTPFAASALFQCVLDVPGFIWGNLDNPNFVGWGILAVPGGREMVWGDGTRFNTMPLPMLGGNLNTWCLATLVNTGSSILAYLNGMLVGERDTTTVVPSTVRARVGVLDANGNNAFTGIIAGVTYTTQIGNVEFGSYFTEVARTLELGMTAQGDDLCGALRALPNNAWQVQLYNAKLGSDGLPALSWAPAQGSVPLTRVDTSQGCMFVRSTPAVWASAGALGGALPAFNQGNSLGSNNTLGVNSGTAIPACPTGLIIYCDQIALTNLGPDAADVSFSVGGVQCDLQTTLASGETRVLTEPQLGATATLDFALVSGTGPLDVISSYSSVPETNRVQARVQTTGVTPVKLLDGPTTSNLRRDFPITSVLEPQAQGFYMFNADTVARHAQVSKSLDNGVTFHAVAAPVTIPAITLAAVPACTLAPGESLWLVFQEGDTTNPPEAFVLAHDVNSIT